MIEIIKPKIICEESASGSFAKLTVDRLNAASAPR
jgi:hypothetical protein